MLVSLIYDQSYHPRWIWTKHSGISNAEWQANWGLKVRPIAWNVVKPDNAEVHLDLHANSLQACYEFAQSETAWCIQVVLQAGCLKTGLCSWLWYQFAAWSILSGSAVLQYWQSRFILQLYITIMGLIPCGIYMILLWASCCLSKMFSPADFLYSWKQKLRFPQQSWFLRAHTGNCYCSHNKFPEYSISIEPRMLFPMIYLAADFKFPFHVTAFLLFNQRSTSFWKVPPVEYWVIR